MSTGKELHFRRCWVICLLAVVWPATSVATDYVVDTTADTVAADGQLSLREAVLAANSDAVVGDAPAGTADGDSIRFGNGFPVGGVITLTGGELMITDDLFIDGRNGGSAVILDAGGASRHFAVDAAAGAGARQLVRLRDLSLRNGRADRGGAIHVAGSSAAVLGFLAATGNVATGAAAGDGGGVLFNAGNVLLGGVNFSANDALAGEAAGGAILQTGGELVMLQSELAENRAAIAGGGLAVAGGAVQIQESTLAANRAESATAAGGGIHASGNLTLEVSASTLRDNFATSDGGGLWIGTGVRLALADSLLEANRADGAALGAGGGGLYIAGGHAEVRDSRLVDNRAARAAGVGGGRGGAILNRGGQLEIVATELSANIAAGGGGALADLSDTGPTQVTVFESTLSGNTVGPGAGGAIHAQGDAGAILIDRSTLVGNGSAADGGAVWNGGARVQIVNSTLSDNQAGTDGGGVSNTAAGILELVNTTVAGNVAVMAAGGIANTSQATLSNALLGDNTAGAADPDARGEFLADFSLIEDPGSARFEGQSNLIGVDPGLEPLGTNGGATRTRALRPDSPAIGAADGAVCDGPVVGRRDQRGLPRDGACDIGAYEFVDGPVLFVENRSATALTVAGGETNLSALAFELGNYSGEAVTVSRFSGRLSGSDALGDSLSARLMLDVDGDGAVGPGDSDLTAAGVAQVQLSPRADGFAVVFDPPRTLQTQSAESFIIAVDVGEQAGRRSAPVLAGGALLLLLLLAGARLRGVPALLTAGLLMTACSDGGRELNPDFRGEFQFTLERVIGQGEQSGTPVLVPDLPAPGPRITVVLPSS